MSDPASLQNLHDIVQPAPPSWWPPAPGWYVVLAVITVLLLWGMFRAMKAWQRERYRREALRELAVIRQQGPAGAKWLPVLLKRAALSVWPRDEVASLTGSAWHAFLDQTAATDRFSEGGGALLDRLSFDLDGDNDSAAGDIERAFDDAAFWLKQHRFGEDRPG